MNKFLDIFKTSIGKKLIMALSGWGFILFLTIHLCGNLTFYGGRDFFNAYVDSLHQFELLITVSEFILLTLAHLHILTGVLLFIKNLQARPKRYVSNKWGGGRTIASAIMPYTGMFIFIFLFFHLLDFHYADKTYQTVYHIVTQTFENPLYTVFYLFSMAVVALHVSHGFWSLFQTLGVNHYKYMPFIRFMGIFISIIFGIGFGSLPLYIALSL